MGKKRIQRGISQRTMAKRDGARDHCRGPKRTHFEAERDRAELATLDIFNTSQADLAAMLSSRRPYKVSQQTISRDLKIIKAEWDRVKNLHLTDPVEFERKFKNPTFMRSWLRCNVPGVL
jgi:hypothetical protein